MQGKEPFNFHMILAIDIGNSSISVGLFDITKDRLPCAVNDFKIKTKNYSSDEYSLIIKDFLRDREINIDLITDSVISSVVPNLTDTLMSSAYSICSKKPFLISSGIHTGFGIKIKNPNQLGADIVSNVAAAITIVDPPAVIVDMGTATTITVIDENKNVIGTIITPGIGVALEALNNSAAQLDDISLEPKCELIGRDTRSSICSGIINGNIYMIDGFIRNIKEELGLKNSEKKLGLIATGGAANLIVPFTRNKFAYYSNLTLLGEALLYQKNRKKP